VTAAVVSGKEIGSAWQWPAILTTTGYVIRCPFESTVLGDVNRNQFSVAMSLT